VHNILSEIFNVDHALKDNFRKRLERARRDLYQFMQNECGLLNTAYGESKYIHGEN
jgi:hypothetical protein